jgi:hypothetical protein
VADDVEVAPELEAGDFEDPHALIKNGVRPILLGLACRIAVALVSLAAQGLGI